MKALTRPLPSLPAGSTVDVTDEAPSVTAPAQSGPATVAPAVVVNLIGPPDIQGLARPITRTPVKRLLIVLVLNSERLVSADELAMAISGKADRDPKASSLHSYASVLRGSLPPGVFPESVGAGYQLTPGAVWSDWSVLNAVAGEDRAAEGWADRAAAALELVRGVPLTGVAWPGVEPVALAMSATVERLAHDLAVARLAGGEAMASEWAIVKGLIVLPASPLLWQVRLDAAAAGSGYGLDRAWKDAQAVLKADAGLIGAHYEQLRRQADERRANV